MRTVVSVLVCGCEVHTQLVRNFFDIVDEKFAGSSDNDETEDKILVEFGVTPRDAVALTILCDSEIAKELVTNGVDIEDETFADTSDDDE